MTAAPPRPSSASSHATTSPTSRPPTAAFSKRHPRRHTCSQAHGSLVVLSWGSEDGLVDVFEVTETANIIHRNFLDTMSRHDVCHEERGNDVRSFVFQLTGLRTALHAQHDAWESEVAALGVVDDHDWASVVWLKMTSWMPFSGGGRKDQLDRLQALVAHTEKLSNHLVRHETELQNHGTCFSNTKKDLDIVNGQVVKAWEAVLLLQRKAASSYSGRARHEMVRMKLGSVDAAYAVSSCVIERLGEQLDSYCQRAERQVSDLGSLRDQLVTCVQQLNEAKKGILDEEVFMQALYVAGA